MKKSILLIFILLTLISKSQTNESFLKNKFAERWKNDSLGKVNFRNSQIAYDNAKQTILINGIDIRGFSKEKVILLLSKPNESGIHKEDKLLIMSYKTKYFSSKQSDEILIYFDKKNTVSKIVKKEDRSDLYFKK